MYPEVQFDIIPDAVSIGTPFHFGKHISEA